MKIIYSLRHLCVVYYIIIGAMIQAFLKAME